jgi:hypothetical protein
MSLGTKMVKLERILCLAEWVEVVCYHFLLCPSPLILRLSFAPLA